MTDERRCITGLTGDMSLNFEPETLNCRARPLVGYPRKRAADLGKFARQLDPPLSSVGTGEELSVMATCQNQVGIGGMGREALHVSVRRDGKQRCFPSVTAVRRALYRAEATERVVADRRKNHFRIVLFKDDAAAVRQGKFAAHAESLPIDSAIGADADLIGESDQGGSGFAGQRFDVMNIGLVHEPAGWTCPGVAAVPAHPNAVDLDAGPDELVIRGIYHQSSDSRRGDISALCRKIRREILPVLTAVP